MVHIKKKSLKNKFSKFVMVVRFLFLGLCKVFFFHFVFKAYILIPCKREANIFFIPFGLCIPASSL